MGIKSKLYGVWKREIKGEGKKKTGTAKGAAAGETKPVRLLLLTNRDSDNVGDQVLEACDVALLNAAMKNLNVENYKLTSRSATIVTQKYMETKQEQYLGEAKKVIADADIIIFGGAPQFNFQYQYFARRTSVILELAEQYGKKVLFSAIGVEGYDENHPDCRRLKKALNSGCVSLITTRDDLEALQKYVEDNGIQTARVADPAVFAAEIFKKYTERCTGEKSQKKKAGIFILRANGFVDNKIMFSREEAAAFWKGLVLELENRGYDYELLTSGHFGDEAFLDRLIRRQGIDKFKCIFGIDTPERLVEKISSFDVVVTCRLHPSIISYSLQVPSLGIVWNSKVRYFYQDIHYGERLFTTGNISPSLLVDGMDRAIETGVARDEEFCMSVYRYLFEGLKGLLRPEENILPYSYAELVAQMPVYKGTSDSEKQKKWGWKLRRIYGEYNALSEKDMENKIKIGRLTSEFLGYSVIYNGGLRENTLTCAYPEEAGKVRRLVGGNIEYYPEGYVKNNGESALLKNEFTCPGYIFRGWYMRVKEDEKWYWYLSDKTLKPMREYDQTADGERYVLEDQAAIPVIPAGYASVVVFVAVWDKE